MSGCNDKDGASTFYRNKDRTRNFWIETEKENNRTKIDKKDGAKTFFDERNEGFSEEKQRGGNDFFGHEKSNKCCPLIVSSLTKENPYRQIQCNTGEVP